MKPTSAHTKSSPVLGYANCWEDAHVLCAALHPQPGKRILSIASGGDNLIALAADGADIVAVDRNPAQIACVELKLAALRRLDYHDVLGFFGLIPFRRRGEVFRQLETELSAQARAYWNARMSAVMNGFVHSGKFERYFRMFRRCVLPLVHRRAVVRQLFVERSRTERERFYGTVWNNTRWRIMARIFFSRAVVGRLGRDAAFFRYVEGDVAAHALALAQRALVELPAHSNPFLEYIATGTFRRCMPRYLDPGRFASVREGLARVTLIEGQVEAVARAHRGAGFDGFNLSDIFEYLGEAAGRELHRQLLETARPGARLAYWNMMVPRRFARDGAAGVVERNEIASTLQAADCGFFYRAFVLEEVPI